MLVGLGNRTTSGSAMQLEPCQETLGTAQMHVAVRARRCRSADAPLRGALCIAALTLAQATHAAGFFINQQTVRGLGRVNAGVAAAADEPSTTFFNAAGLAHLWCGEGGAQPAAVGL